jgi:PTS system nitrogen regulatory IIA component
MKLVPFLSAETIEPDLKSTDRRGVLSELAGLITRAGQVPEGTDLLTILENREELGSTGIGDGIAIPHVRLKNLDVLRVAVGRSAGGVQFEAIDGKPVHLFFLLLAPEDSTGTHLRALAKVSRLLKNSSARRELLAAGSSREILEIIAKEDEED